MKKRVYHWQPELSSAIIYWSCTFGILFLSLILTLEHTRPYLISNVVLGIFFFFVLLGHNRYFIVEDEYLIIHAILPVRRKKIPLSAIEIIRVGSKCIEIKAPGFKEETQMFIMTKKNKTTFIEAIKNQTLFKAQIIEDPDLTISKHY
ncbi:EbsA family protein [Enterococcus plantarum]|uniref:EbsA family protein n=1 Tax=Enterococcus plantarum TaxID=1077675 RepID=UPI001A8D8A3E|nr:EbsA family protein [Enterococcus plantarum]MBO0468275.1 EbsA family protein [Enterococcus plantarum]